MSGNTEVKYHIQNVVSDLVSNFLYYDRKGDEDLPVGAIEAAVAAGDITVEDIVAEFRANITNGLSR